MPTQQTLPQEPIETPITPQPPPERQHYIDALRVIAVWLLIIVHAVLIFAPVRAFQVTNPDSSELLGIFTYNFLNQWQMPLFMLLAGSSAWYALRKRSRRQFIEERFFRIMVPYIIGLFTLAAPMMYIGRLHRGQYDGSFFTFLPTFFTTGTQPQGGNFTHENLWFLLYLFLISVITLPLLIYLRGEKGRALIARVAAYADNRLLFLFVFPLPLLALQWLLRPLFPWDTRTLVNDFGYFFLNLSVFIYGYVLVSHAAFGQAVSRHWRVAGVLALLSWGGLQYAGYVTSEQIRFMNLPVFLLHETIYYLCTWMFLVALLGLGRQFLNRGSRLLTHLGGISYPYYMVHQLVVIGLGYYIVRLDVSIAVKFTLIVALSTVLTYVLAVAVTKTELTRFMFGLRMERPLQPALKWSVAAVALVVGPALMLSVFVASGDNPQTEGFPRLGEGVEPPAALIEAVAGQNFALSRNAANWQQARLDIENGQLTLSICYEDDDQREITAELAQGDVENVAGVGFWLDKSRLLIYDEHDGNRYVWELNFADDRLVVVRWNAATMTGRGYVTGVPG